MQSSKADGLISNSEFGKEIEAIPVHPKKAISPMDTIPLMESDGIQIGERIKRSFSDYSQSLEYKELVCTPSELKPICIVSVWTVIVHFTTSLYDHHFYFLSEAVFHATT